MLDSYGLTPVGHGVVGRVLGDGHVVRVRFEQAGLRDGDETAVAPQRVQVGSAAVAHGGPQAAGHLVDDVAYRPLISHHALDALGYELGGGSRALLEVTIGTAARHGPE